LSGNIKRLPQFILMMKNLSSGTSLAEVIISIFLLWNLAFVELSFLFAQVASPDAKIISIDLPGGPFGGGYPEWKIPLYISFARANQKIYLLRGDSHNPSTLNKVKLILGDQKLDFLFIDGDHSYEGVKKDFEMYAPLVRKGGMIAFHDIVEHPPETGCQVNRFWSEVKRFYTYTEIVKNWNQRWAGIGVLFV